MKISLDRDYHVWYTVDMKNELGFRVKCQECGTREGVHMTDNTPLCDSCNFQKAVK